MKPTDYWYYEHRQLLELIEQVEIEPELTATEQDAVNAMKQTLILFMVASKYRPAVPPPTLEEVFSG